MDFVVPAYSKEKVNRAGDILVSRHEASPEEVTWALAVLTNWRAAHSYPINTFQATLRVRLEKIDKQALVAQRLKRSSSIISKLTRFSGMRLARMQDIGGLRAVVGNLKKVRQLEEMYRAGGFFKHELTSSKDYIECPKDDGYRSVHLVFRYRSERAPSYDGLHLELQIRTRLQHTWATAVETMSTFLGQALKSGEGTPEWREFFSLTSAVFADIESTNSVPGYEGKDRHSMCRRLADMEAKLRVLQKLRSFSIAADQISARGGPGSYHLIVLDFDNKSVEIRPYSKKRLELANEEYSSIEREAEGGRQLEAVLVSAGPIEALRRAYPNYFLDTNEFISKVTKLIEEATQPVTGALVRGARPLRTISRKSTSSINPRDIPQADNLDTVRVVLAAIEARRLTNREIVEATGYSPRHVAYKLATADILGCIVGTKTWGLTAIGSAWLRRPPGSEEEMQFIRALIESTTVFKVVAPDLFHEPPPSKVELASRIRSASTLARTTAERRASTLSAWAVRVRQCCLAINDATRVRRHG